MTFLFADLRDYTRFVEQFGDAAASTLIGDYRRIVRGEVARASGAEVKTEGDSFYVVFESARAAVTCGMGILREAERYSKDRADRPIKVGVGIHAGEPTPHEGQYVGAAVIVAARLAQSAGAGELLISDVVHALLPKEFAPPARERDGLTLKGIAQPPRVLTVDWRAVADPRAQLARVNEVAIEAAPPSKLILCPELVGRDAQLGALEAALRDAGAGNGRTVLLAGEAGLGKSALLRAFAERARTGGSRVLLGECTEVEARRPFGPFIDALSAAGLPLPPELAQGGPGALPVAEVERYRVHAGFARVLSDAAASAPLVMAIEDLHWADEATLELVPYLARKLRGERILLLGTYRSDELHRLHPLNHLLAELSRSRLAEEVRLRRLTEDETAAVIRGALKLGRAPTSAFRQAIFERCEGNPFFVEEVLRALVERGDLEYREGAWRRTKEVDEIAIPVSVRDAVQQRLKALTPDARRAMQVGAVIGQRFDFELLQRVSGTPEAKLLEILHAAIDEQLIEEESGDDQESYRFRHALTRESVLAELLQRERRLLHRAVGEAIEGRAAPERYAEELAYHFDEARDAPRAFRYHELAARQAQGSFAFASEAKHLERAIELAADDDPALAELHLRLADAAYLVRDVGRAERAAREAMALAGTGERVAIRGAALRRIAFYAWWQGEDRSARDLVTEAIDLLAPLGPSAELARAHAERGRLAVLAGDVSVATEASESAIQIARAVHDAPSELDAMINLGLARSVEGDLDTAAERLREAARRAVEERAAWHADRALHNIWAGIARLGGEIGAARRVHEDAVTTTRRFGLRSEATIHREAWQALEDGDWDRALAVIEEGRSETSWATGRDTWEALIRTARDGPGDLTGMVATARRRAGTTGDINTRAAAIFPAAVLHIAEDWRGTLEHAELGIEALEDGSYPMPHMAAVAAIDAALKLGDATALERWLERAERRYTGTNRHEDTRIEYAGAVRAAIAGDRDAALQAFARFVEQAERRVGWPILARLGRLGRADLLIEAGDRSAAQAEVDLAAAYWRKARATWYLGRLAEWARERGLTLVV